MTEQEARTAATIDAARDAIAGRAPKPFGSRWSVRVEISVDAASSWDAVRAVTGPLEDDGARLISVEVARDGW